MNQKRNVKHRSSSKQFLPDKEKRTASNKKNLSFKKVFKIVFYCSIFIAFIYAVVASPLLKIKKVEITGLQTLNNSEINDQVEKILASSYLNQNILFKGTDDSGSAGQASAGRESESVIPMNTGSDPDVKENEDENSSRSSDFTYQSINTSYSKHGIKRSKGKVRGMMRQSVLNLRNLTCPPRTIKTNPQEQLCSPTLQNVSILVRKPVWSNQSVSNRLAHWIVLGTQKC